MVEVRRLTGADLLSAIDDLARLRMAVFAEWPYLYDGSLDYERKYLEAFAKAPGGVLVAAVAEDRIVGCATGSPLFAQGSEVQARFQCLGADTSQMFYFGESVLLPEFRGQCFVVQSPTVGMAYWSPAVDINRGAAGIFAPPDGSFSDDGVIALGDCDMPQWLFGEIDIEQVETVRREGAVLNRRHWQDQPGATVLPPVECLSLRGA